MTIVIADAAMRVRVLATQLSRYAFRYSDETQLQAGIAEVLGGEGYVVEREVKFPSGDRVDLRVDGIVIEVKVDGSFAMALRQVDRYAHNPGIEGIILAGTPFWAKGGAELPQLVRGIPFEMIRLRRQAL